MATKEASQFAAGRDYTDEVTIVLAGKSGAGKSTLLATLLGQSKESIPLTANPDTKIANRQEITRNDIKLTIIDIPGYVDRRFKVKPRKFDVLVYCMPISPALKFHDANPEIMRKLQHI